MNKSDESRDENLVNSVVGLGYLGLPFAIAFSEKYYFIGVDTQNWSCPELVAPDPANFTTW